MHSSTAAEVDQQGVGRGHQRACKGTQNQPHHRSVTPLYVSFTIFRSCVISYLRGGDGVQVFHRRATLARALLHTSRFLSVAVSCVAYCSGYSVVIYPMFSSLVLRRHRIYTYIENKSYFYLTYCDRWQPTITLAC
jgi:hypothetical protein